MEEVHFKVEPHSQAFRHRDHWCHLRENAEQSLLREVSLGQTGLTLSALGLLGKIIFIDPYSFPKLRR